MLKQPNSFYSHPSVLSKDAAANFHLSATFGSGFKISSVAPTRSSPFYPYLIGNCNLKIILTEFTKILFPFLVTKSLDVSWKIFDLTDRSKKSSVFFIISQLRPFLDINFHTYRQATYCICILNKSQAQDLKLCHCMIFSRFLKMKLLWFLTSAEYLENS